MSFDIGGVSLNHNLIMAPLAGYTDVAFRRLVTENGAAMAVTEMISARALARGSLKTAAMLRTAPSEQVTCLQLFGHEPEDFTAALQVPETKKFDIIDINCGCPVKKVIKNGEGSALMDDIPRAAGIVAASRKAARRPVTVKIRLGRDEESMNYLNFAAAMVGAGAAAVTLHARTAAQLYRGKADWEAIAALKKQLGAPVIGSGDVTDAATYDVRQSLGDAVMIGRGALSDPGIFLRLRGVTPPSAQELVLRHLEYLKYYFDERYAVLNSRKFMAFYLKGRHNIGAEKRKIMTAGSYDELVTLVKAAFKSEEA